MAFTTEGFFEVAVEVWPEWNLNPGPLNALIDWAIRPWVQLSFIVAKVSVEIFN